MLHDHASDGALPEDVAADMEHYVRGNVPVEMAKQIAALGPAFGFLDLSNVAVKTGHAFDQVAMLHSALDERLDLSWLRERITLLPRDDHWETMARSALRDDYFREHAELTEAVLQSCSGGEGDCVDVVAAADLWLSENALAVERCRRTFAELRSADETDLARASVAVRALSQLTRTT